MLQWAILLIASPAIVLSLAVLYSIIDFFAIVTVEVVSNWIQVRSDRRKLQQFIKRELTHDHARKILRMQIGDAITINEKTLVRVL